MRWMTWRASSARPYLARLLVQRLRRGVMSNRPYWCQLCVVVWYLASHTTENIYPYLIDAVSEWSDAPLPGT